MDLARRGRQGTLALLALMLLLAACAGTTKPHTPGLNEAQATPPPGLSAPELLAWNVLHAPRPARSLVDLALRLRHVAGPIPTVARTAPLNRNVGDQDTFWVRATDTGYQQITATLVYVTPHVYDYVENGATVDLGALKSAADTFENTIYPAGQRFFGSEWNPGIDDDPHVTILNATDLLPEADGYFSPADEVSRLADPFSNEREMIYLHIGPDNLAPADEAYLRTMTHEFQHLIHWHQRPTDPTWLDEAMSVLAQHLNGYDTTGYESAFMADPATPLDAWDPTATDAQFGAGFLFVDYFAEHYGGYSVLKQLLADPAQAPLNFDDVLAANGYTQRFDDVFAQWVVANALNDTPSVSDQAYRYKTVAHQHVTAAQAVTALPFHAAGQTPQYAAAYYDVTAPDNGDHTLTVAFAGATSVPVISGGPPAPGAAYWWSNRGANIDTTLTRSFDLRSLAGKPVALTFDLWYDLTPASDYGYVEVSNDGGKTWQTLPFAGTTTDDPNGLNAGNGLTGASGGDAGPAWTPATVDLSPYAGQQIQVRFELATDVGADAQGIGIGQIAIPALGYTDGAQGGASWTARGWLRVATPLPQDYAVQVVVFPSDGSAPVVQPLAVGANGQGQLTIAHFGGQNNEALIIVAPLAPATTVPAAYTLDVSASG